MYILICRYFTLHSSKMFSYICVHPLYMEMAMDLDSEILAPNTADFMFVLISVHLIMPSRECHFLKSNIYLIKIIFIPYELYFMITKT